MKIFPIIALPLLISGCQPSDIGRYQMIIESSFQIFRLDTKTGEVVYINTLPVLTGEADKNNRVITVLSPAATAATSPH